MSIFSRLTLQSTVNIDEAVDKLKAFPQIIVIHSDATSQYFVTVEKQILVESENMCGALLDLIATYFTFDIAYPKSLYPVLLFFQHFVLDLTDSQTVPNSVSIFVSALRV